MPEHIKTFMVEDAKIIYRNFSGRPTPWAKDGGKRTFNVVLDPKTAQEMDRDGWNVKFPKPTDEGDEREPHIQVELRFDIRPPHIVMITSTGRTDLTKDTVDMLDSVDFEQVDLIANSYSWQVGDKSGIKAYLKSIFITIEEDYLERKYAIVEDAER